MSNELKNGDRVRNLIDRYQWLQFGVLSPYWEYGVVNDQIPNKLVWVRPDGYSGDILMHRDSIAKETP